MPILEIKILTGRSTDQKRALVKRLTEAVSETIDAPAERVRIHIIEMESEDFAVAGTLVCDRES